MDEDLRSKLAGLREAKTLLNDVAVIISNAVCDTAAEKDASGILAYLGSATDTAGTVDSLIGKILWGEQDER